MRISLSLAPVRRSASMADCNSRSVMNALKRLTTMPKRCPAALSEPCVDRREALGLSILIFLAMRLCKTHPERSEGALSTFTLSAETTLQRRRSHRAPSRKRRARDVIKKLFSFERRRPLLQKRRGSLFLVFRGAGDGKERGFKEQAFGQGHLHPLVHRFQRVLHRQRRVGDDFFGNLFAARKQLRQRHHFVDQADAQRFLSGNLLASEEDLQRRAFSHQPRQPLAAAISGDDPQLHLWLAQLGVF